ncbi:MAG: Gfo/Idh/MocA family oxidoreductase [Planctomycetaceae bacterium]|jgi:predicted dehydrogenase|nr:Gfo/Idh/MocA family oxidoreductase [Planctomycetaceae bacterium]
MVKQLTKNFGIIGCGMIAGFHAKAIEAAGGKLIACYDMVPQSADRLASQYSGCKAYHGFKEFLADDRIDIVTIGTPSGAHIEPALAVAEAGKHLIVEKPLEVTLERCDRIIAACQKSNVKLATVFHSRFHDSSRKIKTAIDAERFGRLTLGDAIVKWYRTQEYYDSGAWRGTWELDGGGALMNQAIHTIDLLTWLMGPVTEITAHTALLAHERIDVEDVAVATLKFANGALGTIVGTTASYPGYLKRVEISGSKGSAVLEEEDIVKWDFAVSAPEDAEIREAMTCRQSGGGGAADPSAINFSGHAKLFANMIAAIEGQEELVVDGNEGRRSVEIILGIYKSAESGQIVRLPLVKDPEFTRKSRQSKKLK